MHKDHDAIIRETARLATLHRLGLLDSPAEPAFDRLTQLAARVLRVPVTLISLVDANRQFFKSQVGLGEPWATRRETPLSHSFCQYVVGSGMPMVIEDAPNHPLVCNNLAIPDLGVVAYAGVPLQLPDGTTLGSFCAIDTEKRQWTDEELEYLRDFADMAMTEIKLRADLTERQRTTQRLGMQVDLARMLVEVQDITVAAARSLMILGNQLSWDSGCCWILDNLTREVQCQAYWTRQNGIIERCDYPLSPLARNVWASQQPVWIADVPAVQQPDFDDMRSVFTFPIQSSHEVVGVVALLGREPRPTDDHMLVLAGALGSQIGLFVERIWSDQSRVEILAREQEARVEAEQALRSRDEFLSVAAHELKTPVTTLYGHTQVLQRRLGNDEANERNQRSLRIMGEQARRLSQMMDQMLDVSRIVTGHFALDRHPVDLAGLTQNVVEQIEQTLERHTITMHVLDEALIIDGDDLRLEQVLFNLIGNAIKYSPSGGEITITLSRDSGDAVIAVADQGIGIPEAARRQLFERFYRAENVQHTLIGGMGIGLYVVQEIVSLHNGRVDVASVEGEGSTFTVRLPL